MKKIDNIFISESKPFIIAEVGVNHNGSIARAKKMILEAKKAGADAVKFQTFKADELCTDNKQLFTYFSKGKKVTEPMMKMFKRLEFPDNVWEQLSDFCKQNKIIFFSSPQNLSDLKVLNKLKVPAIKIGSDDFINIPLLKDYRKFNLPIILSCGMSNIAEVYDALEAVDWFNGNSKIILMLCTSSYPTPPEEVNVNKLLTLKSAFPNLKLGFSDHTIGSAAAILALAHGARVFEKHFTLSNNLPGPDHWFSENPISLKCWIDDIRTSYKMLGGFEIVPTKSEKKMKILARRSIVTLTDISKGEIFTKENIGFRRPGDGLKPIYFDAILGKKASKQIKKGHKIDFGDFV